MKDNFMEELFKEQAIRIKIYLAVPSVNDPFEKDETLSELPSLPIDAIVNDLSFSKVKWNMDGISTDSAKEIYIEKKNESLLEQSYKIQIEGINYEGYKVLGKMQIKTEGDYCRIYCYRKEV